MSSGFLSRWAIRIGRAIVSFGLGAQRESVATVESVEVECWAAAVCSVELGAGSANDTAIEVASASTGTMSADAVGPTVDHGAALPVSVAIDCQVIAPADTADDSPTQTIDASPVAVSAVDADAAAPVSVSMAVDAVASVSLTESEPMTIVVIAEAA